MKNYGFLQNPDLARDPLFLGRGRGRRFRFERIPRSSYLLVRKKEIIPYILVYS